MTRLLTIIVPVLIALSIGGRAAQACSCAPESEEEMIQRASLAVLAEAIGEAPFRVWMDQEPVRMSSGREGLTLFRVLEVVAGRLESERIAVVHKLESSACGMRFRSGERWLLTFRARESSGKPAVLRVGLCHVKLQSRARAETASAPAGERDPFIEPRSGVFAGSSRRGAGASG